MDKKIVSLVGAVAVLAVSETVQAMPAMVPNAADILKVQSYGELLDPIPNAVALLHAVDAAPAPASNLVQPVQYYHHHHHHAYWGRYPYYHHHHHHHYGLYYAPYATYPDRYYPY